MNIWSFLQLCVSGLFTGLSNALIVVGYVGIRNRKRDVRFAVIYGVLVVVIYVVCNIQMYIRVPFGLQMLIYLIGYGVLFGGTILYRLETGFTNFVGYYISLTIYDAVTLFMTKWVEQIFHYKHSDSEAIYSAKELGIKLEAETVLFLMGILVQYVVVKKLMPYKKLKSVSISFKLFWSILILLVVLIAILYMEKTLNLDSVFQIRILIIEVLGFVIGYYIFMFLYRRHQKKALSLIHI